MIEFKLHHLRSFKTTIAEEYIKIQKADIALNNAVVRARLWYVVFFAPFFGGQNPAQLFPIYIVLSWCIPLSITSLTPYHTMTAVPPCCRAVKGQKPDAAKAKAKAKVKAKTVKEENPENADAIPEEEEDVPEPSRKKAKRRKH